MFCALQQSVLRGTVQFIYHIVCFSLEGFDYFVSHLKLTRTRQVTDYNYARNETNFKMLIYVQRFHFLARPVYQCRVVATLSVPLTFLGQEVRSHRFELFDVLLVQVRNRLELTAVIRGQTAARDPVLVQRLQAVVRTVQEQLEWD